LDFAATVEKGKRIKDNTRRRYEEKFTLEKVHEEGKYTEEILHASMATPIAFRKSALSLNAGSSFENR
jgi:hypothetical protein